MNENFDKALIIETAWRIRIDSDSIWARIIREITTFSASLRRRER